MSHAADPSAASASQPGDGAVAVLATRGFVTRPGRTIAMATVCGLLAMSASFALSAPPFIGVATLIGGILTVFLLRAGNADFRLTRDGLHRTFAPFAALGGQGRRTQFFPFSDMRSWRRERDYSRSRREEVERLVLALRRPPYRIVIHDMMGKEAFAAFAESFATLAAAAGVPRRPGFYATIWAKLILAVFALAAGALMVLSAAGALSPTNTFRLMVVILPGVGYMGWRILATPRSGDGMGAGVTERGG